MSYDPSRCITIRHDGPRVVYSLRKARIKLKIEKIYILRCSGSFGTGFDQCRISISWDWYFRKIDENLKIWKWFWQKNYENFNTKTLKIEKKTKKILRGRPASWEACKMRFKVRFDQKTGCDQKSYIFFLFFFSSFLFLSSLFAILSSLFFLPSPFLFLFLFFFFLSLLSFLLFSFILSLLRSFSFPGLL